MQERTRKKIHELFRHDALIGVDGKHHEMDGVTQINIRQCEVLAQMHYDIRPELSIETGLAYGFSSLPILDMMDEHDYGYHIAIDPGQKGYWNGVALVAIEELQLNARFEWIEARSDRAFPNLITNKQRAQFIFLDGLHQFDAVLTDFFLADQVLEIGGLLIINDMWMPAIRALASFIETNKPNYAPQKADHENIFVAKKIGADARQWDDFVAFNSAGINRPVKTSLFSRLFG